MTNYTNDRVAKAKTLFAHAVLRARHQPSSSKDFGIHSLASFRATIESVSQQTLRTAVYSQEFNKVNSVVR